MWTEDGWIEDRWFDIGSSSSYYPEVFDQELTEPKEPIGFIWPTERD